MSERRTDGSVEVEAFFSADRAKAFIDAVVAIAMTLLILPLLDAITGLARVSRQVPASTWFSENWLLLLSFLISFVIIAMFWINHHRMFARVVQVSVPLLWLNMAWLLTIVWLPVATAMTNIMDSDDPVVKASYMGTMALTSLLAFFQELFLNRHPELHQAEPYSLLRGMAVYLAMTTLFLVALGLSIALPVLSYFTLFLLGLTGPLSAVFDRMLGVPRERGPRRGARKAKR